MHAESWGEAKRTEHTCGEVPKSRLRSVTLKHHVKAQDSDLDVSNMCFFASMFGP
jgi:hypothetical protein